MSKDDNEEVLAMARAFREGIKDAEELYQALKAENARLRAALADMIEYASSNEMWQEDHPEYVEKARQLLGEERLSPSSVVLNKINKSNGDFDEYVIETVNTGGEK